MRNVHWDFRLRRAKKKQIQLLLFLSIENFNLYQLVFYN